MGRMMLKLHATLDRSWPGAPFVTRIEERRVGERGVTTDGRHIYDRATSIPLPDDLDHLDVGDVVRVIPATGELVSLYRRRSAHNSVFVTGRCNSRCVMCSQPPVARDDSYLLEVWQEAIALMDTATRELGFTGGEPTLLGDGFVDLIRRCQQHLPTTAVHVLSNGRLFNYLSLAKALGDVDHHDLMVGVPLYSDLAAHHNFVVQADDAFDQTLRGIMNLKRCGVRVELRVVLHRATARRLPQLARFVTRNLPNVDHVALMGFEQMGFGKSNLAALWLDPLDYADELAAAVDELATMGMATSIYNHQLCTLPEQLWPFARQSISDWKNEFVDACTGCAVRSSCGGFFSSSTQHISRGIAAVGDRQ